LLAIPPSYRFELDPPRRREIARMGKKKVLVSYGVDIDAVGMH
jgi:hypothetical protein